MAELSDVMTFLIIDEDRFTRAYLRSTLGRRPRVRILEAETALKGLEVLSHTPVDAVVMDLLVSDFDGLALLELIRSHPGSARAQVVVGSSQASAAMVKRAQELGVGDYFVKPLQAADIEKRLSALVQRVEKSRRLTSGPDGAPQRQRVVVADNDRNFCAFAHTTLSTHYDVKPAISSLGIVALVNSWGPDLLLLNPGLRGLNLGFLMRHLWPLPASHGMHIHLLGNDQELPQCGGCQISGWLPRTFVPEDFRSGVAAILEPDKLNTRTALSWLRKLEPDIITAVQQVFGMMTKTEASLTDAALSEEATLAASLRLASRKDNTSLLLELLSTDSLGITLAAKMTDLSEAEIDEELMGSGVTEVLNVVGGRLLECCKANDLPLKMGLPKIGLETPPQEPIFQWQHHFCWGEKDVFQISLRCFPDWPADK